MLIRQTFIARYKSSVLYWHTQSSYTNSNSDDSIIGQSFCQSFCQSFWARSVNKMAIEYFEANNSQIHINSYYSKFEESLKFQIVPSFIIGFRDPPEIVGIWNWLIMPTDATPGACLSLCLLRHRDHNFRLLLFVRRSIFFCLFLKNLTKIVNLESA